MHASWGGRTALRRHRDADQPATASGGAPNRFLVEVKQGAIETCIYFGLLRPAEKDDLEAVLTALKRLGRPPVITRVQSA